MGATYLSGASEALRDNTLPILDALVTANEERAEDAMGGQHPWWLLLVGILALLGIVWLNRQLGRHFRRRINVGLAVATGIVLLVSLVTIVLAFGRAGDNDDLRAGDFRTAVDQAAARTAANDAKANESLRLINRGSGELYEAPWRESAEVVEDRAASSTLAAWREYVRRHEDVVVLDDEDRWGQARENATARTGDEATTVPLDAFDAESQTLIDEAGTGATDELRSGRSLAIGLAALTLLLGVAASIAVARGIGARRREYA